MAKMEAAHPRRVTAARRLKQQKWGHDDGKGDLTTARSGGGSSETGDSWWRLQAVASTAGLGDARKRISGGLGHRSRAKQRRRRHGQEY